MPRSGLPYFELPPAHFRISAAVSGEPSSYRSWSSACAPYRFGVLAEFWPDPSSLIGNLAFWFKLGGTDVREGIP